MAGKSKNVKTKTQMRRESYPYRKEYFRRNPGLFGFIWFCSQCGRPLIGQKNVVVDHIVPLNKHGINRTFNTVACCIKCNSAKSDSVDGRVVKGYFAKLVESLIFTIQKIILIPITLILTAFKTCFAPIVGTKIGRLALLILACLIVLQYVGGF